MTKPQKKEEILDNSGTNVVVNSGGSEVTITIRKVGDEVKNKQELRRHELPVNMEIDNNYSSKHFENHGILSEIRDMLVLKNQEKKENENLIDTHYKQIGNLDTSNIIQDLSPIFRRLGNFSGNQKDTGFFGILKTKNRVYPIVMGEAGKKMARNTSVIQQHLKSPLRTRNLLLTKYEGTRNKTRSYLPIKNSGNKKKILNIFQRLQNHQDKNISASIDKILENKTSNPLSFIFNGLPVLQEIKNNVMNTDNPDYQVTRTP